MNLATLYTVIDACAGRTFVTFNIFVLVIVFLISMTVVMVVTVFMTAVIMEERLSALKEIQ